MAASPRLVLVDGSAMLFRAYYAIPANLRTSTGQPINAVYGFATMFQKLLAGRRPEAGAVVFDAPGPTFRDEQYPEYKANRERPPEDLTAQRPWVDRLVEAHGYPILRVKGFEADDVIGTLTERASRRGMEVLIVSGDKDFVQLLGPKVRMLDAMRDVTYDPELARKKWGVSPERFVDMLALMGDKIDNIPGVPGIGKKGAAELLERFGDLDAVLASTDQLKGKRRENLEAHADDARMSRALATIDRQVPLPLALDDLELPEVDQSRLNVLYKELEFYSLLGEEATTEVEGEALETPVLGGEQLAAWLSETETLLAIEPVFDPPALDTEALVGLGLARSGEEAIYVDLRSGIPDALAAYLADPDRPVGGHDTKLLRVLLATHDQGLEGVQFDTQLASFLVDPNKLLPHRLDQLAKDLLQRPLPPAKRFIGSGKAEKRFAELPPEEAASWAGHRAATIWSCTRALEPRLRDEGQAEHLAKVDLPLSELLSRMEIAGIRVNAPLLEQAEAGFVARLDELEASIHELAGHTFNIGSTKQLATVLFEELKLPVIKKTKTGYSTNAEVLERLAREHPIAEQLLEHRKLAKLVSTYTKVLRAAVREDTGRVHACFQQTVGVTGRLITTDPDLQRTPIKTAEGEKIREAFVPRDGWRLVSADWSQIELRLLAHFSEDPVLQEAFREEQDVHARTASELFDVPLEQVDKHQRRIGKTVNFATVYGQGATALGQILNIPRKEAKAYIDGYFATYAGVRRWLDATIATALQTGYVETLDGRRRYIPELSSNAVMERSAGERIAANTPIQGSAADICKAAMLRIDRELSERGLKSVMMLQIHDELLFDCPPEEVETVMALAREVMSSVVKLSVPLVTDVGVGGSWAEAH